MIFGPMVLAAGVVGLVVLANRFTFRRRFHDRSCGGGRARFGRRGWGGGPGGSFWLRALFHRLDTTPGQEREIRAAVVDFQETVRQSKRDLVVAREDLARAMGREAFDESAVDEAGRRAETNASSIKDAFKATLGRVHAVLDASQRERLAELLREGPRFRNRWGGGPYRSAGI